MSTTKTYNGSSEDQIYSFDPLTSNAEKTIAKYFTTVPRTYEVSMTVTSGSGTAIVELYGRNIESNSDGFLLATLNVTDTSISGVPAPNETIPSWPYVYFKLVSVTGTGASVVPSVGV